jgi:FMN reductase (NADPH)
MPLWIHRATPAEAPNPGANPPLLRCHMNETLRLMGAHRSIRRFKPDPVPDADLERAVRAGQMASTSSNVQAYSVIHVTEPERLDALAELSGPQEKVRRCGAFLVICADTRRHRLIAERVGEPFHDSFENFLVATADAALFAQNLSLAFESMGYGICYIGGIRNDLPRVASVLNLPSFVYPVFGLCVGLPDEQPSARPRLPVEAVLSRDTYPDDATLLAGIDAYDTAYIEYLAARGARPATWSESVAQKHNRPTREEVGRFYRDQGAPLG